MDKITDKTIYKKENEPTKVFVVIEGKLREFENLQDFVNKLSSNEIGF